MAFKMFKRIHSTENLREFSETKRFNGGDHSILPTRHSLDFHQLQEHEEDSWHSFFRR